MSEVETPELISPREAYDIASGWGSYMRNGDPGAVFYSFPGSDATPQGPRHRAQLIAYTKDCLEGLKLPAYDADREELKAELESLLAFFERFPDSGEETREEYRAESAALIEAADPFTKAYLRTAVWTGVELPDGHPDRDSDKNNDLNPEDIHPESLADMIAVCARFQRENADDLAAAIATGEVRCGPDFDAIGHAGHDFWLTRNGHGAGFWDGDWPEPYGERLTAACKAFGESDLYTGDDGAVRLS